MFRIFTTIFLFRFLIMASPIVGMFSAFMLETGNSPIAMAIIFISFSLATNIFEIPSSVIADRFSRKMVIICAIVLIILCNLVFLFSQSTLAFVFHMVIAGIGVALFSGTVEAFAYDELKAVNEEGKYGKLLAFYHTAFSLGLSVSLFLSSWLVQFGWYVIVMTSLCTTFASLVIFTFGAIETKPVEQIKEAHSIKDIFIEGKNTILQSSAIKYLAAISIIYGAIAGTFGDVASVSAITTGWRKEEIARVFGFNTIFEAIIIMFAAKYLQKMKIEHLKYLMILAFVLCAFGMFFHQKWSIFLVLPLWWTNVLKNIVIEPQIQASTQSSSRATVSSCINMFLSLKYIIFMLILGVIANYHSFAMSFVAIAIVGLIELLFVKKPRN